MTSAPMRRRSFLTLLGGASAAAWPLAARGQQSAMPVIGFLGATSRGPYSVYTAAVHEGLRETGFIRGQNAAVEERWAEGRYERLPALAAELVSRRVAVIVPFGGAPAALAAKAATSTIPIVFNMGADPVQLGLVVSLNRPGGNVTGVAMMVLEIESKRLELLCELVPGADLIAVLVNPSNPQSSSQSRALQEAAGKLGRQILVLGASSATEIESAYATLVERRAGALLVAGDTYFGRTQIPLLVGLAARHRIPAAYAERESVVQGGLMSYGTNFREAYRQAGAYAGRILKGEKPADLPVMQVTKFEFVLNLKTAKALGLEVPLKLNAFAEEVIE